MTTTDTRQLLSEYAKTGSEAAFRELLARYIDLVYSTSVRLVDGDSHRANDVAQTVFLDLARDASKLSSDPILGGWLHRHTCFVAAKVIRGERRRRVRELHAAEMHALNSPDTHFEHLAPVLDEAINELGDDDRKAILLRFFEQRDLRGVGEAMGASENAAQKRIARALEQLHKLLVKRGIAFPATALAAALGGEAVTAAPAGMAAGILTAVLTGAAGGGTAIVVAKSLFAGKAKLAICGAFLIGAASIPLVQQHQAHVRLQAENESLRKSVEQFGQLSADNERLSNLVAQANSAREISTAQMQELSRLRGEVGRLRQANLEATKLQAQNRRPSAAKVSPKREEIIPAGKINFPGIVLQQFLDVYREMVGTELELEDGIDSLPVKIRLVNTEPLTRPEAIKFFEQALFDQAGIVVTHPETNRVVLKGRH